MGSGASANQEPNNKNNQYTDSQRSKSSQFGPLKNSQKSTPRNRGENDITHLTKDEAPIISVPSDKEADKLEISDKSPNQLIQEVKQEKHERMRVNEEESKKVAEGSNLREKRISSLKRQLDEYCSCLKSDYKADVLKMDTIINCIRRINAFHPHNINYYEIPVDPHSKEKYKIYREKATLLHRLSEIAGARLRHNNPDIADLSDPNRATKLAEKISELYDNEWTDTFEAIRNKIDAKMADGDKLVTVCLYNVLKFCYKRCEDLADRQRLDLCKSFSMSTGSTMESISPFFRLRIKEFQKNACPFSIAHVQKVVCKDLSATVKNEQLANDEALLLLRRSKVNLAQPPTRQYIERCTELSWYTQIQDPPVVIEFDNNNPLMYRPYTRSGPRLDYVIWPLLLLHHGGPLLAKGVAQFKKIPDDLASVATTSDWD